MSIIISLLVIIVLCIAGALLSASETAVVASSKIRLYQLAKKGSKKAELLIDLQKHMNTLISSILLANTWIISGMTAIVTPISMEFFGGGIGVLIASISTAIFITIYIEVIPKVYVYRNPEKCGMAFAPVLRLLRMALLPVTTIIDKISHYSLMFVGVNTDPMPARSSIEDLRGAIDLHAGEGGLESSVRHEKAMLNSILDLSKITVEEIMVHRKNMVSFSIDLSTDSLIEKIFATPYTRIPLWEGSPDNIIGVINIKSIAAEMQKQKACDIDIRKIMTKPWFIPDTSVLFAQLQMFREKHVHQAFVVDEYGALLGMLSLEDILEEIVGEILDEHDVKLSGVRITADGHYIINADVALRDLNREYGWELPHEDSTTIGGLVIQEIRGIPDVGSKIHMHGFEIKVLRKQQQNITLVRAKRLSA